MELLLGLKVTRIIAKVTQESLELEVNRFLMLREILHENSASRALLSQLGLGKTMLTLRFRGSALMGLPTVLLKSTWFCCVVGAFITEISLEYGQFVVGFFQVSLEDF